MNLAHLANWLLTAMGTFYPQENHNWKYPAKNWYTEDRDITEERYELLAYDIAITVSQPYIRPLFTSGQTDLDDRAKTGLLLVSIASDESHYKEDVMFCGVPSTDGNGTWGPFQTQRAKTRTCYQADSIGAAGVALEMAHESFRICQSVPLSWRLSEYTDGNNYNSDRAHRRSALKVKRVLKYWAEHPYQEK